MIMLGLFLMVGFKIFFFMFQEKRDTFQRLKLENIPTCVASFILTVVLISVVHIYCLCALALNVVTKCVWVTC